MSSEADIKSSDLRDGYAQQKYRNQSKSTNKKVQDVAHYFSLDIAAFLNKFVHPSVPINTLKSICNNPNNFRMINKTTNRSNHKQIDNKLMNSFRDIILPKFNTNQKYKTLLQKNHCQLELAIKNNQMTCVTLKANEASRARAQAKRIQQLNFPNHYAAFVRLFYRCFKDSKGRYIWSDIRNTAEFKQYLKTQIETQINDDDIDEKNILLDETLEFETVKYDTNTDKMVGIDSKGRTIYQGKKGGTYYKTASGRKKYIKNDDEKIDLERQKIVNEVCKQKVNIVSSKSEDKIIGKDDKERVLYEGNKGGKYYKTVSGKKVYVKGNNNDMKKYVKSNDNNNVYGTDDKGRTLYKGRKGGVYYLTQSGKKAYVKAK